MKPRIEPLADDQVPEDIRKYAGGLVGPLPNLHRTLAHHEKLGKRWFVFANHILAKNSVPARERELAILRIGWLCGSEYEFGHHARIGRMAGLSDEEIKRVTVGPDAPGWSAADGTLVRAADELFNDQKISDATWAALSERFDTKQMMDLVFTIGNYNLVSMVLNTLGVQREDGTEGFPK
jgi:4-carboxymuconolactone decarboxylase